MTKLGEKLPRGDGRLVRMCVVPLTNGDYSQQIVVLIRVDRLGCTFPPNVDSPLLAALLCDEWYLQEFRGLLADYLREAGCSDPEENLE